MGKFGPVKHVQTLIVVSLHLMGVERNTDRKCNGMQVNFKALLLSLSGNSDACFPNVDEAIFVYTSHIRYGDRAASTLGKHASLFSYHKDKKYVYVIICSIILLSFSNMCMLENIC